MDPGVISGQIDKILRSQSFASKNQLRKLLEVLFHPIDAQNALSPDLVIRELWPTETRTKRSADVATEMNRLRHALEAYYEGERKNDPITINLPNRSVAANGAPEKRWIVATPRGDTEETAGEKHEAAAPRRSARRTLKIIGVAAVVAAALGIAAYVSIRMLAGDRRPQIGRLDGSTLTIMNAEGKELWRKAFPEGFAPDWPFAPGLVSRIWFGDLEGKGHTSVLFVYSPAVPQSRSNRCHECP